MCPSLSVTTTGSPTRRQPCPTPIPIGPVEPIATPTSAPESTSPSCSSWVDVMASSSPAQPPAIGISAPSAPYAPRTISPRGPMRPSLSSSSTWCGASISVMHAAAAAPAARSPSDTVPTLLATVKPGPPIAIATTCPDPASPSTISPAVVQPTTVVPSGTRSAAVRAIVAMSWLGAQNRITRRGARPSVAVVIASVVAAAVSVLVEAPDPAQRSCSSVAAVPALVVGSVMVAPCAGGCIGVIAPVGPPV